MSVVIVWSKPACQQCRVVKLRLDAASVPFEDRDLTGPENVKDLEYFRGLGFSSAPITEYGGIRPGQKIMPLIDGGWAHTRCPEERQVCGVCFTIVSVSGACMCEAMP